MTRKCTPETRNALKTALKRVVSDLGGLHAAATCTRVGASNISDYGNVDNDKLVPVDVVVDLEMISGRPHVTMALAIAQGYTLVAIEAKRPKSDLVVYLARIGQDAGVLFGDAATALAHKRLTPAERAKLTGDLSELANAVREASEWLMQDEWE